MLKSDSDLQLFVLRDPLFRKASNPPEPKKRHLPSQTRRPPGNVPYVVDNLWEWTRPPEFPCRRHAIFACPDPNAIDLGDATETAVAFQITLFGACKVAQIEPNDARFHKDCKGLTKALHRLLNREWMNMSMGQKIEVGRLWMPCLSAEEVEELFTCPPLSAIVSILRSEITIWKETKIVNAGDVFPFPRGEVFFEAEAWVRAE